MTALRSLGNEDAGENIDEILLKLEILLDVANSLVGVILARRLILESEAQHKGILHVLGESLAKGRESGFAVKVVERLFEIVERHTLSLLVDVESLRVALRIHILEIILKNVQRAALNHECQRDVGRFSLLFLLLFFGSHRFRVVLLSSLPQEVNTVVIVPQKRMAAIIHMKFFFIFLTI